MTTGARVSYSTTGAGCTCSTAKARDSKTGAVTNKGGADSAGRGAAISTTSTISVPPGEQAQCPNSQVSECPGPSGSQGSQRFSRRSATVGSRLSTPRPAPVEPARPAQQGQRPPSGCTCMTCTRGHRPPCRCTAAVESQASSKTRTCTTCTKWDIDHLADVPARPAYGEHRPPCRCTAAVESLTSSELPGPQGSAFASRQGCRRPCRWTATIDLDWHRSGAVEVGRLLTPLFLWSGPVVVQQRACQQPCPRSAPVGSPRASAQFAQKAALSQLETLLTPLLLW